MSDEKEKEWCCWKLTPEVIVGVAKKYGLDVDEEEYDEIARKVKKGIEWGLDDIWEEVVKNAVKDTPPKKVCPRCGDLKPKDEFEEWHYEDIQEEICMSCVTELESRCVTELESRGE